MGNKEKIDSDDMCPSGPSQYHGDVWLGYPEPLRDKPLAESKGRHQTNLGNILLYQLRFFVLGTARKITGIISCWMLVPAWIPIWVFSASAFISRRATRFSQHVGTIVGGSSEKKVVRAHAISAITFMQAIESVRNWSVRKFPRKPVCSHLPTPIGINRSIAGANASASPNPAFPQMWNVFGNRTIFVDPQPELFNESAGMIDAHRISNQGSVTRSRLHQQRGSFCNGIVCPSDQ